MKAVTLISILAVASATHDPNVIKHVSKKPEVVHSPGFQKHHQGINYAYPSLGNSYLGTKALAGDSNSPYGVAHSYWNPIVPSKAIVVPTDHQGYNPYGATPNPLLHPSSSIGRFPLFQENTNHLLYSGESTGQELLSGKYPSRDNFFGRYQPVKIPSQSYGVPALTPTYTSGFASVKPGYSHGVNAVPTRNPYGIADPHAHQITSHHQVGQFVPSQPYGHGHDNRAHDSHEPPVYSPGYSLSYAPHSFSPVYPQKVESRIVPKGYQYGKQKNI